MASFSSNKTDPAANLPPDPRDQSRFVAALLLATIDATSTRAAQRLIGASEEMANRYAPQPTLMWCEQYRELIRDLAASVAAAQPALFAERLAWFRAGFESRGVPVEDLTNSLIVLASVLDREFPEADRSLVANYLRAGFDALRAVAPVVEQSHINAKTTTGRLAAEYLVTVLQGERRAAVDLVVSAVVRGTISPRDAYLSVLSVAQREIGRMWHAGEITIPEEHSASATTQTALALLAQHLPRSAPNGKTVVTACIERNVHDLGLRMVADFFEAAGWRAIYVGANTPREDIVQAAETFQADLVALSATLRTQLEPTREAISQLRAHPLVGHVKVVVGGQAFAGLPEYWKDIGADGYAACPDSAVRVGSQLLGVSTPAYG